MKSLFLHRKGEAILGQEGLTLESLPGEFQKAFPELSPKYIDPISLMASLASAKALAGSLPSFTEEQRKDFAVIVGSAFGAIDSTVEFDAQALAKGPNAVNPMDFPNTVANAAGSRIGIWMQLKGPNITLTNGRTSLIDALGFGWEGLNGGLFQDCLVGAVEKIPVFLKPLALSAAKEPREGGLFFLASGRTEGDFLCRVIDYAAVQLKKDHLLPGAFEDRFNQFWEGVEWVACPDSLPLKAVLCKVPSRIPYSAQIEELGLAGMGSLDAFLSSDADRGVVGVYSQPERKVSFIKLSKKRSD